MIVVHPKYLSELRNLPDDTISIYDAIEEMMHAKYTQAKADRSIFPDTVKRKLTPALSTVSALVMLALDYPLMAEIIRSCEPRSG